ncbi:MAG: TolC family protein [Deltaproteobacteria bacterium]|nr:TolC family protein [Deltaproteobacteria bacterium]
MTPLLRQPPGSGVPWWRRALPAAGLLTLALLLAGCASVQPAGDFQRMQQRVASVSPARLIWEADQADEAKVRQEVDQALAGGLTPDEAVAVALLNNRALQASFEEIGISRADLVAAGLIENPTLGALIRFPIAGEDSATDVELSASFPISDLWQAPLKREVAQATLERVTLEVGDMVLATRRQARQAYNHLWYMQKIRVSQEKLLQDYEKLVAETARRQEFGYQTDLDLYLARDAAVSARLALSRLDLELAQARQALATSLGLPQLPRDLALAGEPPRPSVAPLPWDQAVTLALGQRLDLQATKLRAAEATRREALARSRVVREVRLGANWERDTGGEQVLGPLVEADLPLFHQNQPEIARAGFEARLAKKRLAALEGQVREELTTDLASLQYLAESAQLLEEKVIPLRQQAVAFAEVYAGRMQLDQLVLVTARKDLTAAHRELWQTRQALADAWDDLEYHLGGRLPAGGPAPASPAAAPAGTQESRQEPGQGPGPQPGHEPSPAAGPPPAQMQMPPPEPQ